MSALYTVCNTTPDAMATGTTPHISYGRMYVVLYASSLSPYHVAVDHSLVLPSLQHVSVPLHQALGLGYLLLTGVAVEDVVVALTRGTCPNVGSAEPELEQDVRMQA